MKKGTILTDISIEKLGYGGIGLGKRSDGKVVMIKGGLPGSIVDCKVIKDKKDYVLTHIVDVKKVDKKLVLQAPYCPHFLSPYTETASLPEWKTGCGGTKRQGVPYEKQCELKEEIVYDAFSGLENDRYELYPTIGSPKKFHYRNKIQFSFGKYYKKHEPGTHDGRRDGGKNGHGKTQSTQPAELFAIKEEWNLGFHKQGEFSKVIDIDECCIISDRMNSVFTLLKSDLKDSGLPVYDVKTGKGLLRHMVMREGVHTGQLLVNISFASKHFTDHSDDYMVWKELLASWEKRDDIRDMVTTLVTTDNNQKADNIQGGAGNTEIQRGTGVIFEGLELNDNDRTTFQVSPFSFFQTNTYACEVLFSRAMEMVGNIGGNIIDLYCGSGTIGLAFIAQGVGKNLYGIDVVPSAIEDARKNSKINGLSDKAVFYAGKAEILLKEKVISDECFRGNDLIVVDPPRKGLHKNVIEFLIDIKKEHPDHTVLYISCNPVTMARDVERLAGSYTLQQLQPVDMFPQTHHIELIGILK